MAVDNRDYILQLSDNGGRTETRLMTGEDVLKSYDKIHNNAHGYQAAYQRIEDVRSGDQLVPDADYLVTLNHGGRTFTKTVSGQAFGEKQERLGKEYPGEYKVQRLRNVNIVGNYNVSANDALGKDVSGRWNDEEYKSGFDSYKALHPNASATRTLSIEDRRTDYEKGQEARMSYQSKADRVKARREAEAAAKGAEGAKAAARANVAHTPEDYDGVADFDDSPEGRRLGELSQWHKDVQIDAEHALTAPDYDKNLEEYQELKAKRERVISDEVASPGFAETRRALSESSKALAEEARKRIKSSPYRHNTAVESGLSHGADDFEGGVSLTARNLMDDKDRESINDVENYRTALRMSNAAEDMVSAPVVGTKEGKAFIKGFGDTMSTADFWTMGINSIVDQTKAHSVLKKIQDKLGKATFTDENELDGILSDSEKALVKAFYIRLNSQGLMEGKMKSGYEAGSGAADSAMYMAQFMLAGAGVKAASTAATKAFAGWLGREASSIGLKRAAVKTTARLTADIIGEGGAKAAGAARTAAAKAVNAAAKYGIGLTTDLAKGTAQTVLMPGTYANMADELLANVGEDGRLQDIKASAVANSFIKSAIDNSTESRGGTMIDPMLKKAFGPLFGAVGKRVPAQVANMFKDKDVWEFLKKGGYNGIFGEVGEEWDSAFWNKVTGLDKSALENMATWRQQWILVSSFAPTMLLGGSVSGARYLVAKKNYSAAKSTLEGMLRNNGYSDKQIEYYTDYSRAYPKETGESLRPSGTEEADKYSILMSELVKGNTDMSPERIRAFGKTIENYIGASARLQTFDGLYREKEAEQRTAEKAELYGRIGQFWIGEPAVDGKDSDDASMDFARRVRAANVTDKDGRTVPVFVLSESNDGQIPVVSATDGSKFFITEDRIQSEEYEGADGKTESRKADRVYSLKDYLSAAVMEKGRLSEETRMGEEKIEADKRVAEAIVPGTVINRGTPESPDNWEVTGVDNGMVTILSEDKGSDRIGLDEAAKALGVGGAPMTDAQAEEAEADAIIAEESKTTEEMSSEAAQAEEAAKETGDSQRDEAGVVSNDAIDGVPIPMNEDGTVNQTDLWNASPEAWAKWNTAREGHGREDTLKYVHNAVVSQQALVAEARRLYDENGDLSKRDGLQANIGVLRKRLDGLTALEKEYAVKSEEAKVNDNSNLKYVESANIVEFSGGEAETRLSNIMKNGTEAVLPDKKETAYDFDKEFATPVKTVLGEIVDVKRGVFNKIIRSRRNNISGALREVLEDADFVINDIDGSRLYVKMFNTADRNEVYNVTVVNKKGELEDYISSVHIKTDNNLINKIRNGAKLLLPSKRTSYEAKAPSSVTPLSDSKDTQEIGKSNNVDKNSNDADVPKDFRGNPLPMRKNRKGDTVVNEAALWKRDPEAWCAYNDANEKRIVGTKEFLESQLSELAKQIVSTEKALRKEALKGFDSRKLEDYQDNLDAERAKVGVIKNLLDRYNQAAESGKTIAGEQRRQVARQNQAAAESGFPGIRQRWDEAGKIDGLSDELLLSSGESVQGHYVLTDAMAMTPSHNPFKGFAMSDGFPVDGNGKTVNDRDYEKDKGAQEAVNAKAADYDQRALQTPVFVSDDGVVLSDNDRTMAGQMAAKNGTDGKYVGYLSRYSQKYGFSAEQIASFDHPRVVFVPDNKMEYSTSTFAKFNADDKKTQNRTEKAVKAGKTMSGDVLGQIATLISGYEDINELYSDASGVDSLIGIMADNGIVAKEQVESMRDGAKLSGTGMDLVESMLLGSVLEEDALRAAMSDAMLRKSVASAIAQIIANNTIEGYTLKTELADAVSIVYAGKKGGDIKFGESAQWYVRQGNIFGDDVIAEATVQMLADALNAKKTSLLKKTLESYNREASLAAQGQMDVFSGGAKTKEEILKEILNELGYEVRTFDTSVRAEERQAGERQIQSEEQGAAAEGEQDGASVQSDAGAEGQGRSVEKTSKTEADSETTDPVEEPAGALSSPDEEVETNPSIAQKEAGNYKMGHIRLDGYDITIENPKGSVRRGVSASGKEWQTEMHNDYGYFRGTRSVDGDHIDVFLSDKPSEGKVYVVDQVDPETGKFDEHKVMYGFGTEEEARAAYLSNYEKGWKGLGTITEASKEDFKKWVDSSKRKTKPFSEYATVKETKTNDEKPKGILAEAARIVKETEQEKIVDVGEKIGGARKDVIRKYADRINPEGTTFSKLFPKPDIQKLIDSGLSIDDAAAVKAMYDIAKDDFTQTKKRYGNDRALMHALFFAIYAKRTLQGERGLDMNYKGIALTDYGKSRIRLTTEAYQKVYNELGVGYAALDLSGFEFKDVAFVTYGSNPINLKDLNETNQLRNPKEKYKDGSKIKYVGRDYARPENQYETEEEALEAFVSKVRKGTTLDGPKYEFELYYKRDQTGSVDHKRIYVGFKLRGFGTVDVKVFPNTKEAFDWLKGYPDDAQQMAAAKEEALKSGAEEKLPSYRITVEELKGSPGYVASAVFDKGESRVLRTFANENPRKDPYSSVSYRDALKYQDSAEAKAAADGMLEDIMAARKSAKGGKASMKTEIQRNERVGEDYRKGRDVSAKDVMDTFGFRAIEFGNYATQKDRKEFLNLLYDSLMDLSELIGVSPKALSLNGRLAMAYGARGLGGASGHYEPERNVINITKTSGSGVLAHEWAHALDHYFAGTSGKSSTDTATGDVFEEGTRREVKRAFGELMRVIKGTPYYSRAKSLDAERSNGEYWSSDTELAARAVQDYIVRKLDSKGGKNTFLSNHVVPADWKGDADAYPFPIDDEALSIGEALDGLFNTIQERTDEETGNPVLYQKGNPDMLQYNSESERLATEAVMRMLKNSGVEVVNITPEMLYAVVEYESVVRLAKKKALDDTVVEDESSLKATVVSSNAGSNILKNIDKSIAEYEKTKNSTRGFIVDAAKCLRLKNTGKSQYGTFKAVSGQTITIRLSNHNATVSNFDGNNEPEGISIVISRKPNERITNDGMGHIVEFFYSDKAINELEGRPLVEILKSIKQSLYSGEYKDTTGLAQREEVNADVTFLKDDNDIIYGCASKGAIYLNKDRMNPNTPIHEYTHLWFAALKDSNPELYARGVELMKQMPIWNEVTGDENYSDLKTDYAIASECLSRLVGDKGAEKLNEIAKSVLDNKDMLESAKGLSVINRFKDWLKGFWTWVRDSFSAWSKEDASRVSIDDLQNMTLSDLVKGINPNDHNSGKTTDPMFQFSSDAKSFKEIQKRAVEENGIVSPGLLQKAVMIVNVPKHDFSGSGKQAIAQADEWARNNIVGEHTMGNGDVYNISNSAIGKYLSESATGETKSDNLGVHLAVLKKLPEVINASRDVEIHPDYKKVDGVRSPKNGIGNNELLVHRMYGAVNIDSIIYRVKTTMHEYSPTTNLKNAPHSYEVTKIELLEKQAAPGAHSGYSDNGTVTYGITKLLQGVEKSYDKGKFLLDESEIEVAMNTDSEDIMPKEPSDILAEALSEGTEAPVEGKSSEAVRQAAEDTANALGVTVEYVMAEQMPSGHSKAKGYYKSGRIFVCLDNHASSDDVVRTVIHEAVGHKGIRGIVGEKEANAFLFDLYKEATPEIRSEVAALSMKYGGNISEAMEEWMAGLAEKMDFSQGELSLLARAMTALKKLLASMGLTIRGSFSLNDAKSLLYQSYHSLKKGGILDEAAKQHQKAVAGTDLNGQEQKAVQEKETRFRDAEENSADDAAAAYSRSTLSISDAMQERLQDQFLSVERLQDAIAEESGKPIRDFEDTEKALNRLDSVNAEEHKRYFDERLTPLIEIRKDIAKKTGLTLEQLDEYMMLKHGLERNEVFNRRDGNKEHKDYSGLMAWGESDPPERRSGESRYDYDRRVRETATNRFESVADAEAFASDKVDSYESVIGKTDVKELWQSCDNATDFILDHGFNAGMIRKEEYNRMKEMFKFYVPLRGFSDDSAEDLYTYYGRGASGKGTEKPIIRAKGRRSKAESPISHIGAMADSAIALDNKNKAKQTLALFLAGRPNSAASLSQQWYVKADENDENSRFVPVYPDFSGAKTAEDVRRIADGFEADMKSKAEAGKAFVRGNKKKWAPRLPETAHIDSAAKPEHIISLKINGNDFFISVNGSPRAAQAINDMLSPKDSSYMMRAVATLTRLIARMNTSLNPEFVFSNFERDLLNTVFVNNSINTDEDSKGFWANYPKIAGKILSLMSRHSKGNYEAGAPGTIEYLFDEFARNGGITGFTRLTTSDEYSRILRSQTGWRKSVAEVVAKTFGRVESIGEAIENLSRFTMYVTRRKNGATVERAIDGAKEITVNFNRKGSGAAFTWDETGKLNLSDNSVVAFVQRCTLVALSQLNPVARQLYAFLNAGIQGIALYGKAFKASPARASAWTGMYAALGAVNFLLHSMMSGGGDGDDDKNLESYMGLSEYERRNNMLIQVGACKYLKIAMPQELRAAYAIGDILAGEALGMYPHKNMAEEIAKSVSASLPLDVIGSGGFVSGLMPTGVKPFAEAYLNEDYTGSPIHADAGLPWNMDLPKWQLAYSSTNKVVIEAAKVLSDATIGKEDIKGIDAGAIDLNPATIQHIFEGLFGGTLTFVNKTAETGWMGLSRLDSDPGNDAEVNFRRVPFVSRVITRSGDRMRNAYYSDAFYYYKGIAERRKGSLKRAIAEGPVKDESVERSFNGKENEIARLYDAYKKQLDLYRDYLSQTENSTERREILSQMNDEVIVPFVRDAMRIDAKKTDRQQ